MFTLTIWLTIFITSCIGLLKPNVPTKRIPLQFSFDGQRNVHADGFLKSIVDYGSNRMARRAVGVLQKMPAYKQMPQEVHYTAAIWACAKSDQYVLAQTVYQEMQEYEVTPTLSTFEALIYTAEKTGHVDDVFQLFDAMLSHKIQPSPDIFNLLIWAASKKNDVNKALDIYSSMIENDIPCDIDTYTAILSACDNCNDGNNALKLYHEIIANNILMTTAAYKYLLWALVKANMPEDAMSTFAQMEIHHIKPDEECYNAVIWACELNSQQYYDKAIEYLKLMKFNGLKRSVKSFNGVMMTLYNANKITDVLEVSRWMNNESPIILKNDLTYQLMIETFEKGGYINECMETYQEAYRKGLFIPWVNQSRVLDVSYYHPSVIRMALTSIFQLIDNNKLPLFNLNIIVGRIPQRTIQSADSINDVGCDSTTCLIEEDNDSNNGNMAYVDITYDDTFNQVEDGEEEDQAAGVHQDLLYQHQRIMNVIYNTTEVVLDCLNSLSNPEFLFPDTTVSTASSSNNNGNGNSNNAKSSLLKATTSASASASASVSSSASPSYDSGSVNIKPITTTTSKIASTTSSITTISPTNINKATTTSSVSGNLRPISSTTSSVSGNTRPNSSTTSSVSGNTRPSSSTTSSVSGNTRPSSSSSSPAKPSHGRTPSKLMLEAMEKEQQSKDHAISTPTSVSMSADSEVHVLSTDHTHHQSSTVSNHISTPSYSNPSPPPTTTPTTTTTTSTSIKSINPILHMNIECSIVDGRKRLMIPMETLKQWKMMRNGGGSGDHNTNNSNIHVPLSTPLTASSTATSTTSSLSSFKKFSSSSLSSTTASSESSESSASPTSSTSVSASVSAPSVSVNAAAAASSLASRQLAALRNRRQ